MTKEVYNQKKERVLESLHHFDANGEHYSGYFLAHKSKIISYIQDVYKEGISQKTLSYILNNLQEDGVIRGVEIGKGALYKFKN